MWHGCCRGHRSSDSTQGLRSMTCPVAVPAQSAVQLHWASPGLHLPDLGPADPWRKPRLAMAKRSWTEAEHPEHRERVSFSKFLDSLVFSFFFVYFPSFSFFPVRFTCSPYYSFFTLFPFILLSFFFFCFFLYLIL